MDDEKQATEATGTSESDESAVRNAGRSREERLAALSGEPQPEATTAPANDPAAPGRGQPEPTHASSSAGKAVLHLINQSHAEQAEQAAGRDGSRRLDPAQQEVPSTHDPHAAGPAALHFHGQATLQMQGARQAPDGSMMRQGQAAAGAGYGEPAESGSHGPAQPVVVQGVPVPDGSAGSGLVRPMAGMQLQDSLEGAATAGGMQNLMVYRHQEGSHYSPNQYAQYYGNAHPLPHAHQYYAAPPHQFEGSAAPMRMQTPEEMMAAMAAEAQWRQAYPTMVPQMQPGYYVPHQQPHAQTPPQAVHPPQPQTQPHGRHQNAGRGFDKYGNYWGDSRRGDDGSYGRGGGRRGRGRGRGSAQPSAENWEEEHSKPRGSRIQKNVPVSEMVGRFAEFAADQHGARHIQAILQDASGQGGDSFGAGSSSGSSTDSPPASSTDEPTNEGAPIIATIFAEIIPVARELVKDPFGNYVLQKLLECGGDEQREAIVRTLIEDLVGVCRHPYGCRVVQTALETVAGPQLELLVGRLANEQVVMACVVDSNANHVLQKCIQVVPLEHAGAVVRVFYGKAGNLSMHAYGCRVMQRVMEHVPLQLKGPLLDEVIDISDDLAQDQYANYVLQHVLSHRHTTAGQRDRVVQKLIPLLSTLCCHRYASNVVEKCLEHGTAKQRRAITRGVLGDPERDGKGWGNPKGAGKKAAQAVSRLVHDSYGNYVVQKLIAYAAPAERQWICDAIRRQSEGLLLKPFGKMILERVTRMQKNGTAD